MAIYVWKCKECAAAQEVERPISESAVPPSKCEACGNTSTGWSKVIQPSGFVLKGSGWFRDGYQTNKK